MRYCALILLLLISSPVLAQNAAAPQAVLQDKGTLIRNIEMEGFVLQDKDQFLKLFKPYRNKYMAASEMDTVLQEIKDIYEREGYQQLVSITYHVEKHRLIFTVLMVN